MTHLPIAIGIVTLFVLTDGVAASKGTVDPEEGIVGVWLTEKKGGKIQIFPCGDAFCGKTVWISKDANPAGMDARDPKNPDPKERDRKLVGATIVWNLKWDADDQEWQGGYVYDPKRGAVFRCKAWLENRGQTLKLKGYLGISLLGSTTAWSRTKG
ncbi:MAG: DUF2147 domain-containing protein [Myxococcota bacterium]|nr:DUF2147 domain-containing protein [Myxococcota bacterium]